MTQKDKSTPDKIQNPISGLHHNGGKERRADLFLEPTVLKFCELMTGWLPLEPWMVCMMRSGHPLSGALGVESVSTILGIFP